MGARESLLLAKKVPPVFVAHGQGKYLGQIGIGTDTEQSSSPDEFEKMVLRNSSDGEPSGLVEESGLQGQVQMFNQMFRRIQSQFQTGDEDSFSPSENLRYSFQGEITIDGQEVEFPKPADFQNFKDFIKDKFR